MGKLLNDSDYSIWMILFIFMFMLISSACQRESGISQAVNLITKADSQVTGTEAQLLASSTSDSSPTIQETPQPRAAPSLEQSHQESDEMITIRVVFDNYPYQEGLETAWGFATFVTYKEHSLLFDTGLNGTILLSNMNKLDIQPNRIQHLVLSHEHSDHTGGVLELLSSGSRPTVYVLPSFSASMKNQIREYTDVVEVLPKHSIVERISSTGPISGYPNEQSLVIDTPQGLVVITGCSHPGVEKIVQNAKNQFKEDVILVIGGYHLGGASDRQIQHVIREFKRLGVVQVAPSHCTGDRAIQLFREEYGEDCIRIGAGAVIEIDL